MQFQSTARPRYDEWLRPIQYCRNCHEPIDILDKEARSWSCSARCRAAMMICACGQEKRMASKKCLECRASKKERLRHAPPKLRFAVLLRDGFQCTYCGAAPPRHQLRVDHVIPFAKGGETVMENLTTSCYECNAGKADLMIDNDLDRSIKSQHIGIINTVTIGVQSVEKA